MASTPESFQILDQIDEAKSEASQDDINSKPTDLAGK